MIFTIWNTLMEGFFFVNIYLRCYKISSEGADYKFVIIEALNIKSLLLSSVSVHCFMFFSLLASCDHNDISGLTGSILYPALESMNPDGLQIISVLGMLRLKRQFYRYLWAVFTENQVSIVRMVRSSLHLWMINAGFSDHAKYKF